MIEVWTNFVHCFCKTTVSVRCEAKYGGGNWINPLAAAVFGLEIMWTFKYLFNSARSKVNYNLFENTNFDSLTSSFIRVSIQNIDFSFAFHSLKKIPFSNSRSEQIHQMNGVCLKNCRMEVCWFSMFRLSMTICF